MTTTITRTELERLMSTQPALVLLEALPEKYFSDGHLPMALNMPHTRVRELAAIVAPRKDAEVVIYCASSTCQNSGLAAGVMSSLGYLNVRVFAGGKQEWQEAGLPLET